MYHFIYKTTNIKNGKFYYGIHSTEDLNDGYLGSGLLIRTAISKYGKNNFTREIISFHDTREEALYFEKKLITPELLKDDICYNLCEGGGNPPKQEKTPEKNHLKGEYRTAKQKEAALNHSKRMKNRAANNRKAVNIFDKEFSSVKEAINYYGLSVSQYYYLINSDMSFENADQLKEHIWKERSKKISEKRRKA